MNLFSNFRIAMDPNPNFPSLSAEELSVAADQHYYRIKAGLDLKIRLIFDQMQTGFVTKTQQNGISLPGVGEVQSARWYQGENLQGFPWRAFDHYALFSKDDVFCLRSLFVYGKMAGLHCVLKGAFLEKHYHSLQKNESQLRPFWKLSSSHGIESWELDLRQYFPLTLPEKTPPSLKISLVLPPDQLELLPARAIPAWEAILTCISMVNK